MQLNEFQARFKDTVLSPPDALENLPAEMTSFFDEKHIPLTRRLEVYRNNVMTGISKMMIATFPLIEKLVGKDFLDGMARYYIMEHPPKQGCLNTYGRDFDTFIEGFELAKSLPYLPHVARFEIALNEAYYARDDRALTPEELATIAPEDLPETKLALRNSVNLVSSRYPLMAIKEFCENYDEESDQKLDLDQGGDRLLVYRPKLEVDIIRLDDAEFAMLKNLKSGQSLGEAVEDVLNTHEDFDFQGFLQKYLTLETFLARAPNL